MNQLNDGQLTVYKRVVEAVENENNTRDIFFVYGHGGTGKTFLYSTISTKLRAERKIVLNVASSGNKERINKYIFSQKKIQLSTI